MKKMKRHSQKTHTLQHTIIVCAQIEHWRLSLCNREWYKYVMNDHESRLKVKLDIYSWLWVFPSKRDNVCVSVGIRRRDAIFCPLCQFRHMQSISLNTTFSTDENLSFVRKHQMLLIYRNSVERLTMNWDKLR